MNSIQPSAQRFNSFDLCKFIMAFAVVAIHTEPMHGCTNEAILRIYEMVVGLAVPFFFLTSGYLLSCKMSYPFTGEADVRRVWKSAWRILRLYLVWMLIYAPLAIIFFVSEDYPLMKSLAVYMKGLLFVGEHYNSWPLWYLLSTLYALLLVGFLLRKKVGIDKILIVSFFATLLSLLFNYVGAAESLPVSLIPLKRVLVYTVENGRILGGLIYMPIGMWLSHREISVKTNCVLLIAGAVLSFFFDNQLVDFYLRIITSVGFFGLVLSWRLGDSAVYPFLRESSLYIYLLHMYVWTIYSFTAYGEMRVGLNSFIVTSLGALAITSIYWKIRNVRRA